MPDHGFDLDDYPPVGAWCYLENAAGFPVNLQPVQIVAIAPDPDGRYWAQVADTTTRWPMEFCQATRDRPRPLTSDELDEQFELLFENWRDVQEDRHAGGLSYSRGWRRHASPPTQGKEMQR
jgi:hypothetical protein